MILLVGGLLGFIAIAFGAYAEHGLRADLSVELIHAVATAVRYNQWHAMLVVAIGLALLSPDTPRHSAALRRVAWIFVVGTVLFSFTIYLAAALDVPALTRATPFGGVMLMAGWLGLAWVGFRSLTDRRNR